MIAYRDIVEQREALQNDLLVKLDGLEDKFLDDICNLIIDRFQILLDKLGE